MIRVIVWIVAALAVIRLWLMPIANSFWLDETVIVWAIRDGFHHILQAGLVTPQSPAFCLVEWMVSLVGGIHEPTLRLPSIAAGIGTLFILYRIGVEFVDQSAGLTLVVLYISLQQVAIEIPNARPYSLALLAESAALLFLLRWLRDGRMKYGILWAICAVAAGHLHQFFFSVAPIEAGFVLWRVYRGGAVKMRQLIICCLIGLALSTLAIPQVLFLSRQVKILAWTPQAGFFDLLKSIVPKFVLPLVVLLVLVDWLGGERPRWIRTKSYDAAALGALVLLVPTVGIFVLSHLTRIHVFYPRYLLPSAPGLVLFWGWLLHRLDLRSVRQIALTVGLAASMLVTGGPSLVPDYHQENWRSAVKSLPESGATLVYSGLVESQNLNWLEDPVLWGFLIAPVRAYRPNLQSSDSFVIPFIFDQARQDYMATLLGSRIPARNTITVVTRQTFVGPRWVPWISERLRAAGYRRVRNSAYGLVQVDVFQPISR
jgi:Dolichyl-phosphate-mannose-protein mannosyltransferase